MHHLKPLRWLGFLIGLGVALAIAGAGARPGRGLEVAGGWSTDGASYYATPNPPAGEGYRLELTDVLPSGGSGYCVAGFDGDTGLPIIAAGYLTNTRPEREISTLLFDAGGDTLDVLQGKWLVCPTGARLPDPELLVWWPQSWFQKVHPERVSSHRIDIFRRNYSQDFKLLHMNALERALDAASKGDSLSIYSRLQALVPGEEERLRILVDPLYSAEGGAAYSGHGRRFAVVETDGGYYNIDTYYMLFAQHALSTGNEYTLLGIDDIEGGYRGLYCVDLSTGDKTWTDRTGASPVRTHAADLNGDGTDEIIVQCYSPENSVSGNGMTDAGTSYVLCLDQSGNILWKTRFVGVHLGAMAAAANVTRDASQEVVAITSSTQYPDMGSVVLLSPNGRTIASRSDLGGLFGLVAADLTGDGWSEIVAGAHDGTVLMLNDDLDVIASFTDTADFAREPGWTSRGATVPDVREAGVREVDGCVMPLAAFDLDGDGDVEIITLSVGWAETRWSDNNLGTLTPPRSDLVVLNSSLEEEARVVMRENELGIDKPPFDAPASLKVRLYPADMDGDGVRELLLSGGSRGLFVFKVVPSGSRA
jgi:hypothetical protein